MGVVGDSINLATRLNSVAGCDDLVVSNMLYQHLPEALRAEFEELPPVDVKNMGRVRAWKLGPPSGKAGLSPQSAPLLKSCVVGKQYQRSRLCKSLFYEKKDSCIPEC